MKICKVYVSGILPHKTVWQRLKQLFSNKPEEIYFEIVVQLSPGLPLQIHRMKGLATVTATAQPGYV